MNYMTLRTERLIVRPFSPGDTEALFQLLSDPDVNTFLPWFPLQTIQEADQCLTEKFLPDLCRPADYRFAVCLQSDNFPIGYIHVSDEESHDFGYALRKEFWHKGYITEACLAVVDYLQQIGLRYITATHDINNPRSGEVMKKIGMVYQYSYKEQWQPKNFLVTFRMYQRNFDGQENRVFKQYWERYPVHFVET